MGQGESSELSGIEGFQIVRVAANSPAHVSGLVPFFDFITAVDNLPLDRDQPRFFFDYVARNKDKPVTFRVFNLRVRANRDLTITPTDAWGGTGLLGCNVNWEDVERALESTWHIVEVAPKSPAYAADIMAQRDFIIGMQPVHDHNAITLFRDSGDFHGRIEEWRLLRTYNRSSRLPMVMTLLLFDAVDNAVKEVAVDLSGTISLGVDVANGYLHMVPAAPVPSEIPVLKRLVPATQQVPQQAVQAFPQAPAGVETVPVLSGHAVPQPLQHPDAVIREESPTQGMATQIVTDPSPTSPPPSLVSPMSPSPAVPPPTPALGNDSSGAAAAAQFQAAHAPPPQAIPERGVPAPLPYPTAAAPQVAPLPFPQPPAPAAFPAPPTT